MLNPVCVWFVATCISRQPAVGSQWLTKVVVAVWAESAYQSPLTAPDTISSLDPPSPEGCESPPMMFAATVSRHPAAGFQAVMNLVSTVPFAVLANPIHQSDHDSVCGTARL